MIIVDLMARFKRYRYKIIVALLVIIIFFYLYSQKEYGSELMSQQEFKQPMDRLSEQLLFQRQNKNLHSNNTTNDRFLQGAAGYCNFPNPASIKEGSHHLDTQGYKLQLALMMIRHGDRTPLHTLANRPNPRISCKFLKNEKQTHWIVDKFITRMQNADKDGSFESMQRYPNQPYCRQSYLTPQGAVQELLNGLQAKHKYIDGLDLFQQDFSERKVLVKSTVYPRTYQSANAFMFGFLSDYDTQLKIYKAKTDFCSEKDSGLSCHCPGLEKYSKPLKNMRKLSKPLLQSIANFKRKMSRILSVDVKEIRSLTHVFDSLMVRVCHDVPLPCNKARDSCVDRTIVDTLWGLVGDDLLHHYLYNENHLKTQHLKFHPLLVEMYARMKNITKRSSSTKFVLYSGHDITLTPFLMLLGIYDGKWPPYASTLALELYSKEEGSKLHYFFKVIYNGIDKTRELKFCRGLDMCKFKYFEQFVNTHLENMGLDDYDSECLSS